MNVRNDGQGFIGGEHNVALCQCVCVLGCVCVGGGCEGVRACVCASTDKTHGIMVWVHNTIAP